MFTYSHVKLTLGHFPIKQKLYLFKNRHIIHHSKWFLMEIKNWIQTWSQFVHLEKDSRNVLQREHSHLEKLHPSIKLPFWNPLVLIIPPQKIPTCKIPHIKLPLRKYPPKNSYPKNCLSSFNTASISGGRVYMYILFPPPWTKKILIPPGRLRVFSWNFDNSNKVSMKK